MDIYKIGPDKKRQFKRRVLNSELKLIIPIFILLTIAQYYKWGSGDTSKFLSMSIFLIVLTIIRLIVLSVSSDNLINKFSIRLSEKEVQLLIGTQISKSIQFGNCTIKELKNGFVRVSEKEAKSKGMNSPKTEIIEIPPELDNRMILLNELKKHCA